MQDIEIINDSLPGPAELLEKRAHEHAWDKYVEYLENLYDKYEGINYINDPAEKQAALEVYKEEYEASIDLYNEAVQHYLDTYSLENN